MNLLVWQLADSAFPSGAFAHSAGLEAAWQQGEVTGPADLCQLVREVLAQAGHGMLPLLNAAYHDPNRLEALDALCDAFLSNPVANRASRAQGRALLTTCVRAMANPAVEAVEQTVRRALLRAHYAPIFGAALKALDVPLADAQHVLLYSTCRGALSAAVRLGIIGPHQAQALQVESIPDVEAIWRRSAHLGDGDLAQTAPILDVLQSMHDRLYSRLFQS